LQTDKLGVFLPR